MILSSRLFECPCGWFRDYFFDGDWKSQIIDHPIYGIHDNMDIARMDVKNHSCVSHKEAVKRSRIRRRINDQ